MVVASGFYVLLPTYVRKLLGTSTVINRLSSYSHRRMVLLS